MVIFAQKCQSQLLAIVIHFVFCSDNAQKSMVKIDKTRFPEMLFHENGSYPDE